MMTPFNLAVFVIGGFFLLGMITFIGGILILAFRSSGTDIQALAAQTARLAQKGLAEEVSGLVGNASDLVDAMNQLVRTTRGIGIFMVVIGILMMGIACWLAIQIVQINP